MPERDFHIDPRMVYGDLRRYTDTLDVTVCSGILAKGWMDCMTNHCGFD